MRLSNSMGALVLGLVIPCLGWAQDSSVSSEINYFAQAAREFHSFVRVSPVVGVGQFKLLTDTQSPTPDTGALSGGLLLSLGRGALTVETGAYYFTSTGSVKYDSIQIDNETGESGQGSLPMHHKLGYVGIPLLLKYSYFERPQASFFFKGGAMPAFLVRAETSWREAGSAEQGPAMGSDSSKDGLNEFDIMGVAGVGGTTPVREGWLFLLDISYFRGLTEVIPETSHVNQGFLISAGLSFEL